MRFSDISGHTREIETLRRAVAGACTAHAYLFSGPEGVGKRSVALALASALNCSERLEGSGDPCGACADCRAVHEGRHSNVTVVEPEKGIIKIDRVREVQGGLRYKVGRGKKVVVVDAADAMNPQAANAFLKTLEEPPPDTVIVLLSSKAARLLPTILSRCQRMNFGPLSEDIVAGMVRNELGVSEEEAAVAARLAGGSLSKALASIGEEMRETRQEAIEVLSSLDARNTASILDAAAKLSKRDDLIDVLDFMKTWYRDLAVVEAGAPEIVVNTDAMESAGGVATCSGFDALWNSYAAIERARESITPPRYANKLLAMETLLFRLADSGGAC